ncbi:MAG TPA: GC-type dockerin domain-anchored protein, partial [Phycisphaerales bacterium]|nr:GC-type dockerin domain-anchored protein [Phycisphaerales bacterium]
NAGTVHVTSQLSGSTVSNVTVVGAPSGVWSTAGGATLNIDGVALDGVLAGDHDGVAVLSGGCTLAGGATLTTAPGSNPWLWSNATLDTGSFTLTNGGTLRLYTGFNKFFTGNAVNGAGATWAVDEGSFYFTPGGAGSSVLNNSGTVLIGSAAIRRNGGVRSGALLTSTGTVRATAAGAMISNISLFSGGGSWVTDAGATLELNDVSLSGSFIGSHAGITSFTGSVSLAADASLSNTHGSASPWGWTSAAVDTGPYTLTNSGRVALSTGFNKFLTGTVVNNAGAEWTMSEGSFYLAPSAPTSVTNNGSILFTGASSLLRNGGAIADAQVVNNGSVTSTASGAAVQNVSVVSNGGVWRTAAGGSLALVATRLAGQFIGDHGGTTTLEGVMQLSGDATFSTQLTSVGPWRWTNASIDANGSTFTNTGRLETTTGFNKFLSGAFVNGPTGSWVCSDGTLYLAPSGVTGSATLTNLGELRIDNGRSLSRNGGSVATAVVTNAGLLHVTGSGSGADNLTLVNTGEGVIRIDGGASLQVPADWALSAGRLEGAGRVTSAGAVGLQNTGGTLAPGLGALTGTMECGGRYVQGPAGTLEIAVVGDGVTQSVDRLALSTSGFNGQATLGGTLRVVLPAGTSPAPIGGLDYVIVDAPGGLTGAFASIVDANPVTGYRYSVSYTPTQAVMRVIKRCSGADFAGQGADANFDGRLDNNDFIVFIDLFFAADPRADVGSTGGVRGPDGEWNNNDFVVFIDVFFEGCH